ncbi:hypothetical protein PENTCL1PPCAC_10120, partial [Pristionchus entomophagus]
STMDPATKDHKAMYRLIIEQLYYDGHKQLAIDVSNSLVMKPLPPPSDNLFRLVSAARQNADNTDEEEKEADMQMSLNPVISPIDNLTTDGEYEGYFPILSLSKHPLDLVFSFLSIEDRLALAGVNNALNIIESESKYFVKELIILEMPFIGAPLLVPTQNVLGAINIRLFYSRTKRIRLTSFEESHIMHQSEISKSK